MTLTRDLPADTGDSDAIAALDELTSEFAAAGGDVGASWSQITALGADAGYRLTISDDAPPWA